MFTIGASVGRRFELDTSAPGFWLRLGSMRVHVTREKTWDLFVDRHECGRFVTLTAHLGRIHIVASAEKAKTRPPSHKTAPSAVARRPRRHA